MGSLMHYGAYEFSKDKDARLATIKVLNGTELQQCIGQREGFSEMDIDMLGEIYGCQGTVTPLVKNADLAQSLIASDNMTFISEACGETAVNIVTEQTAAPDAKGGAKRMACFMVLLLCLFSIL